MVAVEFVYVNYFHVYQIWSKLIVIEFVLFSLEFTSFKIVVICRVAQTSSMQC